MTDKKPQPIGTNWAIIPDIHACSFNRVKEVRIEQNDQVVILNQFDINDIAEMLRDD
jgi:hypothetical protein